ncbi:hypothetical protein [Glutamicibacter endophyticus]|uniref:hypothetical protein n=1 Tax=Glutamicibacter endophyticus TaxID=1522174 RepID=UPI003AF08843
MSKLHRVYPALAATAALTFSLGGCTPAPQAQAPEPTEMHTGTIKLDAEVDKLDHLLDDGAEHLVASVAHPTATGSTAEPRTIPLINQDASTWSPGKYELVVRCVGSGQIYPVLTIGSQTIAGEIASCAEPGGEQQLNLTLEQSAENSRVTIIPVGDTRAAVGYVIDRR